MISSKWCSLSWLPLGQLGSIPLGPSEEPQGATSRTVPLRPNKLVCLPRTPGRHVGSKMRSGARCCRHPTDYLLQIPLASLGAGSSLCRLYTGVGSSTACGVKALALRSTGCFSERLCGALPTSSSQARALRALRFDHVTSLLRIIQAATAGSWAAGVRLSCLDQASGRLHWVWAPLKA